MTRFADASAAAPPWLQTQSLRSPPDPALDYLDSGEREAIALAEELKALDGWDSLAIIEYIALVDEMYAVDVPAEQVRKCKRVQDLLDLAGQGITQ